MNKLTTAFLLLGVLLLQGCDLAALERERRATEAQKFGHELRIAEMTFIDAQEERKMQERQEEFDRLAAAARNEMIIEATQWYFAPMALLGFGWWVYQKRKSSVEHAHANNELVRIKIDGVIRAAPLLPESQRMAFIERNSGTSNNGGAGLLPSQPL